MINLSNLEKELNDKYNKIVFESLIHMLKKIQNSDKYKKELNIEINILDDGSIDLESSKIDNNSLTKIVENYNNFLLFLNDYGFKIYRANQYSIDAIYQDLCEYLNIEFDNQYLFEFRYKRVDIDQIDRFNSMDEDFAEIMLDTFIKDMDKIQNSKYYKDNISNLKDKIEPIQKRLNILITNNKGI